MRTANRRLRCFARLRAADCLFYFFFVVTPALPARVAAAFFAADLRAFVLAAFFAAALRALVLAAFFPAATRVGDLADSSGDKKPEMASFAFATIPFLVAIPCLLSGRRAASLPQLLIVGNSALQV